MVSPDHGTRRIQVKTTEKITDFFKKVNIALKSILLCSIRKIDNVVKLCALNRRMVFNGISYILSDSGRIWT